MPKVQKKKKLAKPVTKKKAPQPIPPEVRLARFADAEGLTARQFIEHDDLLEKYRINADDPNLDKFAALADSVNRAAMGKLLARFKKVSYEDQAN